MRVLHVLEALEGGTARHLRDVVTWIPDVEHHVVVPATRVGGITDEQAVPAMRRAGAAVHLVAMTRRPPSTANMRALLELRGLIRDTQADVVHGHSSVGGALARAAAAVTERPRVYTPNGLHPHRAALLVERGLGHWTDRLVAVSASEAALVRRCGLVPDERLRTIANGIDPTPPVGGPDLRRLAGVPEGVPLVLFVGRLIAQKAPELVVEAIDAALRTRPDAYGLLVGDGPQRPQVLAALRAASAHERLRWLPQVDDASAGMASADIVVLLSRFEGAPYVPLEAMRAGVPVVVSDVVGSRDVVDHGVTGLVVPPGNAEAAARAIGSLLADPDAARHMGAQGPRAVTLGHSAVEMGRQLTALYRELVH